MIGTRAAAGPAKRRGWLLWGLTGALAALGAVWLVSTAAGTTSSPCLLQRTTGLACPTCGLTRALRLLLVGDWTASFAAHPLGAPLVVQALLGWNAWARWLARGGGRRPDRWIPPVAALDAAAFVVVWAARWLAGSLPA